MASAGVICDLCRDPIEIYATGVCDHPICHTCATRMRLVCKQNYCSICRTELPEMIFGWESKRFSSYAASGLLVDKLCPGLKFEDRNVRRRFESLIENQCHLCDADPCNSFSSLKSHYTRTHTLFFCDLCVKHLDLFSHERRVYDRKELARHRREGDPDDRSHRGHPLCEFCDQRYFDNDELMKHLRTEHYFCHFCDYDGVTNQYYATYPDLKDHFKASHFLCEEGECSTVQFTNAFRTEIDLKAHLCSTHKDNYKHKGKLKRDLQLDLDFGPQSRGLPGRGRGRERGEEHPRGRGRGRDDRDSPRTVGKLEKIGQEGSGEESSARNSPAPDTAFRLHDQVGDFPTLDNTKPVGLSAAPASAKPKPPRDEEETYIVFSESVDPKTMKPKEALAKVSSGLKAFRTVWTNESGIENDEAFPTLGESLQPKKKTEPPKEIPTAKPLSSGWTLVDDDEDDHPWSQPQSQNTQANKKSSQIIEDPPLPTQAKKEPNGARPKKATPAPAKEINNPKEHFPSLGGKGKSKPSVPETPMLAWAASGSSSKVVPTSASKPFKAPAVATPKPPAAEKSKPQPATRGVFDDDEDSAFPAPNWVSVSATGSGSKGAGKSMNVPLRETSSASVAGNLKLIQKASPELSPRPTAAAAPNFKAEKDFPTLGGASIGGASVGGGKQKNKDSAAGAVGSLNDVASMFASKAKGPEKSQNVANAKENRTNNGGGGVGKKQKDNKENKKAEVEKKNDVVKKGGDYGERKKEKMDDKNPGGANQPKEKNAKNKERADDSGGKKGGPVSAKSAEDASTTKKSKQSGENTVDSADKRDESGGGGGKRKGEKQEQKKEKKERASSSTEKQMKTPDDDLVFDFSIKRDEKKEASVQNPTTSGGKTKVQKETENKKIEMESYPVVAISADSAAGVGVPNKAPTINEAAFPALQSKSRKTESSSQGSSQSSSQSSPIVSNTRSPAPPKSVEKAPAISNEAAFPALQLKSSKKSNATTNGVATDKKVASDAASDLMDWWDVDSHKPKQDSKSVGVGDRSTVISLESTSDFPSFHSTTKSSQPLSLSKSTKSKDNNQTRKDGSHDSSSSSSSKPSPRDAKSTDSPSSSPSVTSQLSLASLLTSMSTSADYVAEKPSSSSSSTATTTTTTPRPTTPRPTTPRPTPTPTTRATTTTPPTTRPTTTTPPTRPPPTTTTPTITPTTSKSTTTSKAPPPGFQAPAFKSTPSVGSSTSTSVAPKPPPGFESTLTNDSRENTPPLPRPRVKPPPGLTAPIAGGVSSWEDLDAGDAWSNGDKKAMEKLNNNEGVTKTDYRYAEPSDFAGRNGRLLADVDATLSTAAKSEFIELSSSFRSGVLTAPDYFRKASTLINAAAGHGATIRIFGELIALLPDICMQMDLYAALQRYMPPGFWGKTGLKACPTCGQVLNASLDFIPHVASHNINSVLKSTGNDLESNFPTLKSTVGIR